MTKKSVEQINKEFQERTDISDEDNFQATQKCMTLWVLLETYHSFIGLSD